METPDIDRKYKDDRTLNLTDDEKFEIFKEIADKVPLHKFSMFALVAIGKGMIEANAGELTFGCDASIGGNRYNLKMNIEKIENTMFKI